MKRISSFLTCLLFCVYAKIDAQNTCATAQAIPSFPFNQTGLTTAGTGDDYTSAMSCASLWMDGDDYVFSYNNVSGPTALTITLANTSTYTAVFVLDGCPDAGGNCMGSSTSTTAPPPAPICVTLPANGTYYIIVSSFGIVNQSVNFDINITATPSTVGSDCANPHVVAALPFSSTGNTTDCYGSNYNSTMVCTNANMNGNDFVYEYTTATTECVTATLSNTASCAGLFLLDGCPDNAASNCIANATGQDPLIGGVTIGPGTYYFVVSSNPACGQQITTYDISITGVAAGLPGSTCGNPQVIPGLPYTNNGLSTCCYGNDYGSADTCQSFYMAGDDYVFSYTSAGNECISIALSNPSPGVSMGVHVLTDCPDAVGAVCVGQASMISGAPSLGTTLVNPGTYYIVVSGLSIPSCTNFDFTMSSVPAGAVGSNCANPVQVPALPYSAAGESTNCMANDYSNASAASCGALYEAGEDKVYEYVKSGTGAECITITLS
ncbi:MAG: hypothetical protein AAF570_13585, partial [Bacteroidota bacterium]